MAGNTLGARKLYVYTADDGTEGVYLTDENLGTAIGATPATSSDPRVTLYGLSKRYVLAENADGTLRKKIVVPTNDDTQFLNGGTLTIDGTSFVITGRVGEKQTFGKSEEGGGA